MGLKFYLLGPPQVTWNDSVLDISRRQVRILLYYLASFPNAIPQERLHYLFWSDKSETECRRNFSHLLTHARSSLPEKDVLIVKDSLIMMDHQRVWCDVVEFKELIRSAQKESRLDVFKQAVESYRGSFLDGLQFSDESEFENLIELERSSLERNYLNLLYKLMLIEKQNGDYEAAIERGYQYLSIDNLSEEVHRQLIMLHGLNGNRERASGQYRICEDMLMRELQAKPSMKTQLVYQRALADSLVEETNPLFKDSVDVRIIRDEPGFVNKESLNQFVELLTGSKPGGIAMLYGELGVGKSSLFSKVLSEYGMGKLVLRTRCDPGTCSLSYWPIKHLLLRECKTHPSISMLMPESLSVNPVSAGVAQVTNADAALDVFSKEYYFTLFANCILALADGQEGLILCIEDMEWADVDTLDLFLHLCRYTNSKKIILLGSYCCPDNENLKGFLDKLSLANGFLGSVKVQGVNLDEIGSMVKYWIGDGKTDRKLIKRLHQLSGGNPFFISEILRWIAESGMTVDALDDNGFLQLPSTISKAVDFRLSRLNRVERRVLEVAAVIGYSFSFEQISDLSDLSVMQILDALDELVNRHFLFARSAKYQFAHELLRQSILEGMSLARRQFLEKNFLGDR